MSTDKLLMEIHGELLEKLRLTHGKPLFITISYKDGDEIEHEMLQNNDFLYEDMVKTLTHLQEQIKKDFDPHPQQIAKKLHHQFKARKKGLRIIQGAD